MLKKYFKNKSKLSIAIDIFIVVVLILLLIPGTRKYTAATIIKATMIVHQPKVNKDKPVVNADAYSWQLQDMTGERIKFGRYKDKVVFINLWATWCPPCIAELPDLQKLYDDYGDRVEFLFISNESQSVINTFLEEKQFTLPAYIPLTDYPIDFTTNSIPTSYLINKKGEIVIAKKGVAQWNSKRVRGVLDVLVKE